MLVGDLDEVTYDLEVDGAEVRRQLHRRIFERRGWATVAVAYQEKDAAGAWKPPKLAILRFQRVRDAWKKHALVTLSGADAQVLANDIAAWQIDGAADDEADE
ncbi:MAG TPA: hypothetical protein VGM88_14405 [Kofleriaceae bacterium]|jgi:hypothetical protein